MSAIALLAEAEYLLDLCYDLQLPVRLMSSDRRHQLILSGPHGETIGVDTMLTTYSMIEQTLAQLNVDFDSLPLLVRGDSKEIRLLTPRIALAKLLPTVYSYTYNRYGLAPGTDAVRTRFTAELFRAMAAEPGPFQLCSAYLGLVNTATGPLLAERVVDTCNLEVRVKRFHIGSPLHRYLYTEQHPTRYQGEPLERWARFQQPLVCFDWRHPLQDESGKRLADEPLSDDYAALWMDDLHNAKQLARSAFLWIEQRFARAGLRLVDICFFIDRTGSVLYGEISPDCMRVRDGDSTDAEALDKDLWRSGSSPEAVLGKYEKLYSLIFEDVPAHPSLAPCLSIKGDSTMKDVPKPITVNNRRLKISPGGIITLPVAARKSLQMIKGEGSHVSVAVENGKVIIAPAQKTGGFRVSPKGQLALQGEACGLLQTGIGRHYWIELDDTGRKVRLNPFV